MAKKVAFEFDPFAKFRVDLPASKKEEAKAEIADFVKEQVLSKIGEGESPVQGGPWKKKLSKEYKSVKSEQSSSGFANLELTGDLLDSLEVVTKRGGTLSLEVKGSEAGKADGNNRGTYGQSDRTDNSKARRFIPIGRETLSKDIWDGIEQILKSYEDEN